MSKKQEDNFLDFIFEKNPKIQYEVDEEEKVTLLQENKGLFNRFFQVVLSKPKTSYIHMEPIPSFVWMQIDGKKTVYEIGQLLGEKFGEEANPLYERLSVFVKQLEGYGFIIKK